MHSREKEIIRERIIEWSHESMQIQLCLNKILSSVDFESGGVINVGAC